MKTILHITFISLLLYTAFSCNNNPIIPPEDQPGRRDYVWTVDTIKIFNNNIVDIWGSAPNDIWGVGPGTFPVWHYDGKRWDSLGYAPGNIYSAQCVYGFAKNDVWIAGGNGRIYHYNGSEWSLNYQHTIDGFTGIWLTDLYGTSNHDLYAVGLVAFNNETRRGIILHYDGSRWEQKYLASFNSIFLNVRESLNKKCFIHCIKQDVQYNSRDTTVFYEFNGKEVKEIYTDEDKRIKGGWMSTINGNIFFSLNDGIYKCYNNTPEKFLKIDIQLNPGAIFGRNEKDMFLGTYVQYGIYHYNGTDIQRLKSIDNGWFYGWALFDKEVFFLVTIVGSSDSYIFHGKLK